METKEMEMEMEMEMENGNGKWSSRALRSTTISRFMSAVAVDFTAGVKARF